MRKVIFLLILLAFSLSITAQVNVPPMNIKERTLANGLQVVTVQDTTNPELVNVPEDAVALCTEIPDAPEVTANDNCDTDVEVTMEETREGEGCDLIITRTWTAVDAFNNVDSSTQVITVIDTLAPTFTTPVDLTINCELRDDISITGQPTNLADNCDTLPDFSFVDLVIGGDCVGGGALDTIIRTWTVMDACGNSSTASQEFILVDTISPTLIGVGVDQTYECNEIPNFGGQLFISEAKFDFEACLSIASHFTSADYSEFTPQLSNDPQGPKISIGMKGLYNVIDLDFRIM